MTPNANKDQSSSAAKVQAHRDRMRKRGYRLVQMWIPDVQSQSFQAEAHRQSLVVSLSNHVAEDQAFIDAISE